MKRFTLISPEIKQLRERIDVLENELAQVTAQLAKQATDPRPAWIRYTSPLNPEMDTDLGELPTAQLAIVPDPEFGRITIDQHNYVRVFHPNGHLYVKYCGPLWAVLYAILEKAGAKRWEAVVTPPYKNRETPIPDTIIPARDRSLV